MTRVCLLNPWEAPILVDLLWDDSCILFCSIHHKARDSIIHRGNMLLRSGTSVGPFFGCYLYWGCNNPRRSRALC